MSSVGVENRVSFALASTLRVPAFEVGPGRRASSLMENSWLVVSRFQMAWHVLPAVKVYDTCLGETEGEAGVWR